MEYTGFELMQLERVLKNYFDTKGAKFSYAIYVNYKRIEAKVKKITSKPREYLKLENFQKYEKERGELCEKHCQRDKDNNPVIENGVYIIKANSKKTFDESIENIGKKYNEVVTAIKNHSKEQKKDLAKKYEIKIHKVKEEDLPESITRNQRVELEFMIHEIKI